MLFPREVAPRLHDAFMAVYRHAGFEPHIRPESFHTGWDVGGLSEVPAVALAPESVVSGLPPTLTAVRVSEPDDTLETCIVWRAAARSPAIDTCIAAAHEALAASPRGVGVG